MRRLTTSEKRLGLSFFVLLFAAANLVGFNAVSARRKILERNLVQLNLEQRESQAWMADKDFWMPRKAWLDEKQPKSESDGQESSKLLETLQQSARQQNITISNQRLIDPRNTANYREVSVQLEVRGRLDSVSRWLAGLQGPERFQAITNLTLKSDAEPPKVICNLTVARWYVVP